MAKKPAEMTKVVRVPASVLETDETLRKIKYKALDQVMYEARYLGNMAIRYAIAFSLKEIPPEYSDEKKEKPVPLDTRIYRILAKERQFLPSGTVATLERNFAVKAFRASNKQAWGGEKSLPTYRSIFVPFRHQGTKISETLHSGSKQFVIEPDGFAGKWLSGELLEKVAPGSDIQIDKERRRLRLVSCFSWKDAGAMEVVRRIINGEYGLCDSQIQKNKKGLTVYLTYKFKLEPYALNPQKICGVDLGVVNPAVCAVNTGPQRATIGSGEDVWAARSKFRAQRRRSQRRLGLYSKTRRWDRSKAENNWILTYYHTLTRGVIKFCTHNNCGTIHLEDLTNLRQQELENEYKRLIWIPSKFNELLTYKAKEAGIQIIKINPRNTSRRCSECGHISKGNRRSQAQFVCEMCGDPKRPIYADYNAARNIALAQGDVIKEGYIPINDEALPGTKDSAREELREA